MFLFRDLGRGYLRFETTTACHQLASAAMRQLEAIRRSQSWHQSLSFRGAAGASGLAGSVSGRGCSADSPPLDAGDAGFSVLAAAEVIDGTGHSAGEVGTPVGVGVGLVPAIG